MGLVINGYRQSASWWCLWNLNEKAKGLAVFGVTTCFLLACVSVLRNVSICAVWEASVEFLTARGGIHTTMVLLQQAPKLLTNISTVKRPLWRKTTTYVIWLLWCELDSESVKRQRRQIFNEWDEALQRDNWCLTIVHHLMRPRSSIYERSRWWRPTILLLTASC